MQKSPVLHYDISGQVFSAFVHLLSTNNTFRKSFLYKSASCDKLLLRKSENHSPPAHIHFRLVMPEKLEIAKASQNLALQTLWDRIELEDALHWLSTLGGAYSNLGEHSIDFAYKACDNAFNQMKIALRSGDPSVVHRCWLYVAMSLMQQRKLHDSKRIIKRVYQDNMRLEWNGNIISRDEKITKMCLGIWARLKYAWKKEVKREII